MVNILYDNKAYYIQKSGGVSVVCYELQGRVMSNDRLKCKFINYGESENDYLRRLHIPDNKITDRIK